MIVKVKNEKDSWSYFECDIVHSKYDTFSDLLVQMHNSPVVFVNTEPIKGSKGKKQIAILSLETAEKHLRTIITDGVCYLLNNNGKTIDKI